jgi:DNA-binding transcriptional LysR family regulator
MGEQHCTSTVSTIFVKVVQAGSFSAARALLGVPNTT